MRTACLNEYVSIECSQSQDCTIQLTRAEYGHSNFMGDVENCTTIERYVTCASNATDIWSQCQDRAACDFYVHEIRDGVCGRQPSFNVVLEYECICAGQCERLPDIQHGVIMYDNPHFTRGTSAKYSCSHGYRVVGNEVRHCTSDGIWTGIEPACSIPTNNCRTSAFPVETFGNTCYEVVEKSRNWTKAAEDCRMRNSTLATYQTHEEEAFVIWWLNHLDIYGYVWGGKVDNATVTNEDRVPILPGFPYQCPQFVKEVNGEEPDNTWLESLEMCMVRNKYICEYDVDYLPSNNGEEMLTMRKKDLILGLTVGLCTAIVLIIVVAIAVVLTKRKQKSCNNCEDEYYDSVGDPERAGDSSYSTSYTDHSQGTPNEAFSDVITQTGSPSDHSEIDEASLYDDVCVTSEVRPKLPSRRLRRQIHRVGARPGNNVYENVQHYNLTESLKRKFLPKRLSTRSSKRSSKGKRGSKKETEVPKKSKIKKPYYVNQQNGNSVKQVQVTKNNGVARDDTVKDVPAQTHITETNDVTKASVEASHESNDVIGSANDVITNRGDAMTDRRRSSVALSRASDSMEVFENVLYDKSYGIGDDITEQCSVAL